MAEPTRSRAVLSTADFELLREAVLHYLKAVENDPKSIRFAQLYHRLGSAMGAKPDHSVPHGEGSDSEAA